MDTQKMRAVQIHAPGQYSVDLVDVPTPGYGEVLVQVESVAICGSDPGIFGGKVLGNGWPPSFPFIAGHEFAGRVAALGPGVTKHAVGDRVVGEAHCGCGVCEMCAAGYYNLCLNYGKREKGHRHYGHNTPGCYAQYQVYDQRALTRMPDNISFDEGALVDTAGTAYNALRLTGVAPGGWTAVIGPGPMGIAAMLLARARGSRTVVVGRRERLRLAGEMGADALVDFEKTEDVAGEVRRICGGLGAHQTIEAAGNASSYLNAVEMTRKGGHAALISIPAANAQEVAVKSLIMNQITLHGVRANPHCAQEVLDLMACGAVDLKPTITHTFPMTQIHEAFHTFQNRIGGALKVIVRPQEE